MKKLLIFILLLFPISVYADECTYEARVNLSKEAAKVTASYDFIMDENNNEVGFKISVYNMSPNLGLSYSIGNKKDSTVSVSSEEISEDGTYSFTTDNLTNVITYNFVIKGRANGCYNTVRTITLVKPIKNKYADLAICKNEYLDPDYYYCRKWINSQISLSYVDVVKKINDEIARKSPTTTTICPSCRLKEKKEELTSNFKQVRRYIIIGLSVGIVLDTIVLLLSIKRARDDIF